MSVNPTMGVNAFGKPKVLSDMESIVNDIMMILLGKPGFYPSIPTLGMNISQYLYQFDDTISIEDIKTKLSQQCNDFSELIDSEDIEIVMEEYNGRVIMIFVLPMIDDVSGDTETLTMAVTTNDAGLIVYNYETDTISVKQQV